MQSSYWVYILVALFATIVGSISGIGGGSILKSIFDAFNYYDASQIAVLTTCTIFIMSLISVGMSIPQIKKDKIDVKIFISIALGSVGGGYLGEFLFSLMTKNAADGIVKIVQNAVLFVIVIFIIIYMSPKGEKKTLGVRNIPISFVIGFVLGIIASFLGIGGGPLNVAVIYIVFGFGMKLSAICSLTSIIFSQGTKLITMVVTKGTAAFCIGLLPYVIVAGVAGGLIGKLLGKKMSERGVNICFVVVQVLVAGLCIFNIVRYSVGLQ